MISQFRITENPLLLEQDGLGILHDNYPQLHISVTHISQEEPDTLLSTEEAPMAYLLFRYSNDEQVMLKVLPSKNYHNADVEKVNQILKRAKRWYVSYLKWEDEQM